MKAELNNENKAKFFALYWGQEVQSHGKEMFHVTGILVRQSYLQLKPLSAISDEDAIDVLNVLMGYEENYYQDWHPNIQKVWMQTIKIDLNDDFGSRQVPALQSYFKYTWQVGDFLRSKGYALPWMGLSVVEMTEAGWIKLT